MNLRGKYTAAHVYDINAHLSFSNNVFQSNTVYILDRFASPLAVRPKEASDGFHTIGDVMPLTASAHVVAQATTYTVYSDYIFEKF